MMTAIWLSNNKSKFYWNEVVGRILSRLDLSTGTYILYHHLYRNGYNDEEMESYQDIFGDMVDFDVCLSLLFCN